MVILFSGPTLSPAEAREVLPDAVCLPPVAQGDVFRAACQSPYAIGIIDGYFDRVPSVWHKEILWAMAQGIHVFGSASMGALRAAELASFGMQGVGAVFEAYRDGVLGDDDEVAVAHGAAEHDYRACSDAMVNIRATLHRACAEGILRRETRESLEQIAKSLFYAVRSYAGILDVAAGQELPPDEVARFRQWLPLGAVNQKRLDALAMLLALRDFKGNHPEPKRVSYTFEEHSWWNEVKRSWQVPLLEARQTDSLVLARLERDPAARARAGAAALGWRLAAEDADRGAFEIDAASILRQSGEFCRAKGISTTEDVESWLLRNGCSRQVLERMLKSHALAAHAEMSADARLAECLLDYLRWTGDYERLASET